MNNLDAVSGAAKMLADIFSDHDGTVLTSCATEGDGQVALAFVNVMGQQVDQQIGDAGNKLLRLREGADIFRDTRVASGERAEFRNKVWIGQKANIEDQIGIFRNTVAESEAYAGHEDALLGRLLLKSLVDMGAQFVNVEFGRIDDKISHTADHAEMTALRLQGGLHR